MSELKTIVIKNLKDINLTHIFDCGQCFRWNQEGEAYVGMAADKFAKVSLSGQTMTIEASGGNEDFWRNYFDIDTDYSEIKCAITENCSNENKLAQAIEYGYGIRILNQDLFETIISFIVSQNNNIPRIKKCIESICTKYGKYIGTFCGEDRYAFPDAEALSQAKPSDLADLKLGYRSEYIVQTAKDFLEKGKPKTYQDVLTYLGVGPKVANCIMLFGLHEVSAFPIDTWVKHIMNDMYDFDEKDVKGMSEYAEKHFGKYAGYAQQYLFYYYRESSKK